MEIFSFRHRHSIRLPGHDYCQNGIYFVTLCVQNRECLFGEIHGGRMRLNEAGEIVKKEWLTTALIRTYVSLDAYVIMPNHLHGILVVNSPVGATRGLPLPENTTLSKPGPRSQSLGAIIALFKSMTGRRINESRATPGVRVWQRNYHDHIIRHTDALNRIRRYIVMNPLKWEKDRENPSGWK